MKAVPLISTYMAGLISRKVARNVRAYERSTLSKPVHLPSDTAPSSKHVARAHCSVHTHAHGARNCLNQCLDLLVALCIVHTHAHGARNCLGQCLDLLVAHCMVHTHAHGARNCLNQCLDLLVARALALLLLPA